MEEWLKNHQKMISFIFLFIFLIVAIVLLIYVRSNVEYIKLHPCEICENKTNRICSPIYPEQKIIKDPNLQNMEEFINNQNGNK